MVAGMSSRQTPEARLKMADGAALLCDEGRVKECWLARQGFVERNLTKYAQR
jgi:hypothetical protein